MMNDDQSKGGKGWRMNRRRFLKTGAVGGAALLLPMGLTSTLARAASVATTLTRYTEPLAIPPVLAYDPAGTTIEMRQFQHRIHASLPATTVWGYGNSAVGFSTPGPTIVVNNNADNSNRTQVTWVNELASDPAAPHYLAIDQSVLDHVHGAENSRKAVVHLHGAQHVTQHADGDPVQVLYPGDSDTYDYAPQPRGATLWYHDHALGNTRLNVYMGLAGAFVFKDQRERDLVAAGNLPAPAYDIPLVLQDRRLKKNGQLAYGPYYDDSFMGDIMMVNGKAWPYLNVQPRKYRFRLLNGSNSRNYTLRLGGHDMQPALPFYQIGSDGGFLAAPLALGQITLTPGERADVVVDFSGVAGQDIDLSNHFMMMGMKDEYPLHEVMQFRVDTGAVSDDIQLPGQLTTIEHLFETSTIPSGIPQRYFKLEDEFDPNIGDAMWHISGPTRSDPPGGFHDPTHTVTNGSIEVWNWVNKSDMIHPMHIHLVQFQVLGRWKAAEDSKGNLIPGRNIGVDPNETGWKDTVRVGPLEFVRVAARFVGDPAVTGPRMEMMPFHCHVIEHEDHEMMRSYLFEY
jgi:spore coat protein A